MLPTSPGNDDKTKIFSQTCKIRSCRFFLLGCEQTIKISLIKALLLGLGNERGALSVGVQYRFPFHILNIQAVCRNCSRPSIPTQRSKITIQYDLVSSLSPKCECVDCHTHKQNMILGCERWPPWYAVHQFGVCEYEGLSPNHLFVNSPAFFRGAQFYSKSKKSVRHSLLK